MNKPFNAPIHSSSMFTWDKRTRTLNVDAWELPPNWLGRIYDDACDQGFGIYSTKTGRIVWFVVSSRDMWHGEYENLTLVPVEGEDHVEGLKVKVWNN